MDTVILNITVSAPELLPSGDLSGLLAALSDYQAVLEAEADIMRDWQRSNYASEGAAFGEPWQPDAPSTLDRKAREGFGDRTLIRTGAMQAAAGQSSAYSGSSVTTGFDTGAVPYAPFQQAETDRKPGRIIVAVAAGEAQEMEQKIEQFLDEAVGGSAAAFGLVVTSEVV